MTKKVLVLGGGVAGCSLAYFLQKKGYKVTLIEKQGLGGLARTCYYSGHPYEFGPHIWFWPDPSPINDIIRELTNNNLYHIDRRLYSYIESDNAYYRYPIHFDDIKDMPDKELCLQFLKKNRDAALKLKEKELPIIGKCTFEEYFNAVVGKPLFNKFMKDYSWKMWNIHPSELQTSMVWADRIKSNYDRGENEKGKIGYDPVKFEDHTLGQDLSFQIYPKNGWNVVWSKMTEAATVIKGTVRGLSQTYNKIFYMDTKGYQHTISIKDYYYVISTLDIDDFIDPVGDSLPYTGRIMIPMLMPDHTNSLFPNNAESFHFSGKEFQTRVTDMSQITKYNNGGRLMLIEVPITSLINDETFPENVTSYAKTNNLYAKKAYAQQSEKGLQRYQQILEKSKKYWPTIIHCGRHAEFRYIGMPETVQSAYELVEERF